MGRSGGKSGVGAAAFWEAPAGDGSGPPCPAYVKGAVSACRHCAKLWSTSSKTTTPVTELTLAIEGLTSTEMTTRLLRGTMMNGRCLMCCVPSPGVGMPETGGGGGGGVGAPSLFGWVGRDGGGVACSLVEEAPPLSFVSAEP